MHFKSILSMLNMNLKCLHAIFCAFSIKIYIYIALCLCFCLFCIYILSFPSPLWFIMCKLWELRMFSCVCSYASRFELESAVDKKLKKQLIMVITVYTVFDTTVECWSYIIWTLRNEGETKADIWQTLWSINIHERVWSSSTPPCGCIMMNTQQDVKTPCLAELLKRLVRFTEG